jgi:hypothetical protein
MGQGAVKPGLNEIMKDFLPAVAKTVSQHSSPHRCTPGSGIWAIQKSLADLNDSRF